MMCSMHANVGRMHVRLNGEPLEVGVIILGTLGRKWQQIEDVKGMWHTD